MLRRIVLVPFVLLPLTGCAVPLLPVEVAEQNCLAQAQGATGPHGSASISMDNHGHVSTGLTIGVTTDFLAGRDPNQVYTECVYRASGQMPRQPLYTIPKP
jgi:hypothetical protein